MEVKIYWRGQGGAVRIDSHCIPPYVGEATTHTDAKAMRDTAKNENDLVAELVERLQVSEEGVRLERYKRVLNPEDQFVRRGTFPTNGTKGMVLVTAEQMPRVERVCVDDVQVWPEAEPGDPGEELEHIMGALREIVA